MNIIKNANFKAGRNCGKRTEKVQYIVIHYTGAEGTAQNNISYFNAANRNASAHYFVGRDGVVCEYCDPKTYYAWHCGGSLESSHHPYHGKCTNKNSIGIEICTHYNGKNWEFTDKAVTAAVEMTKYLMQQFNVPVDRVIRHWDVTGKSCLPIDVTELLTPNGWVSLNNIKVGTEVAQYEPENDGITFTPVMDVVEPREETVYKNRYLEATANHRMYTRPNAVNSREFKDILWGDLLTGKKNHIVKNAAHIKTDGIALTDNEIRLLVWIQGDGSYMMDKNAKRSSMIKGIEFHAKKPRKIARITALLDEMEIPFYTHPCKNGSVHIRIKDASLYYWAETWLSNKVFNYNLMFMNQHQFEVFWDEIVKVDGSEEGQLYSSAINRNNDVVQAICALHGKRSSKISIGKAGGINTVLTANSNHSVGRGGTGTLVEERKTLVSCVTVQSGYILARINNRTFIVGNCPRVPGWGAVGGSAEWDKFKARLTANSNAKATVPEIFVYYPCWARKTSPDDRRGSGCVYIDQDENCLVYDAYDQNSVPSGKLISYMIKHGVTHYTAVGSHAHSDHLGGFFEMLKKAGLKMDRFVCYNPASLTLAGSGSANARSVKEDKAYLQSLISKAKAAGADIRYVGTGDTLTVGSMHFTFWRKQPSAFGSQDTGEAWGYMNHGSLAIYNEETKTLFSADGPRAGAEMLEYFKDKEIKVVDSPHHGNGAGQAYAQALGKRGVVLAIETNNEAKGPGSCSFTSFGSKRIIEAGVPVWMLNASVYGHAKGGKMTWKQTGKTVISYPVDLSESPKVPYTVNVTIAIPILKAPAGAKVKDCPKGIYTIVEERDGYGKLKSGAGWIQLSKAKKM